ncbi:MAG TPA: hypothetical protein PKD61_18495 [Polyangiaceae bacterium]|nr:hypothetical protein [Polyangiaceae bacterium]
MHFSRAAASLLLLVAAFSCSSDRGEREPAGGIGGIGDDASASGGTGGTGDASSTGGVSGAGPDFPSCGEQQCGAAEFCDFKYDWCSVNVGNGGGTGAPRSCKSRGSVCDSEQAVCGCDGNVYENQCAAQHAGVDIGGPGLGQASACKPPPQGKFTCGPWFCDPQVSYCYYYVGDVGDRNVRCMKWPVACGGQGSCDCIDVKPLNECSEVNENGATGTLLYDYSY